MFSCWQSQHLLRPAPLRPSWSYLNQRVLARLLMPAGGRSAAAAERFRSGCN
jgi:hypothetical protein